MPEELQQHRRLAAIMFTDMVGYSALSQKNEARALELLNEHRELLRSRFAAHGGHEIEAVGDGFFVEFPSALEGARCAVDIQRALHDRNASQAPDRLIQVRIGLHLGDVVAQDTRVHGDGVNIAARIEPLAEPGGICLSEDVARQIQNKIELPLLRLGKADLKNIKMAVEIYRLVLPWERKHLPGSQRLAFGLRRQKMRRALIGAGGLLVAGGLTGAWVWRRAQTSGLVNNRIAVLPFVSMSASAEDEYFVDGVTEELISRLSRVKGLEVIARTSIASYKGTKKKIGEIAGELNVGTVLEGSVRKAGGKVRITAQLINASNETHLWSEDYDRELKDIFTVQSDIAQRVADALALRLGSSATAQREAGGTSNIGAYNTYLLGRFHYNKGSPEGLHKAVEYFEEAISQDPSYAVAYAALADVHEQLAAFDGDSANRFPKARDAALKALDLDPSVAEAHSALGVEKAFYEFDWIGARESFTRALALNPNSAVTHNWYGWYLLYLREWDQAIAELRRAVELDPVSIIMNNDLALGLEQAGRWDEAIDQSRRTDKLDPGNAWALTTLAWGHVGKGDYEKGLSLFQKLVDVAGREIWALQGLASAYAFSGDAQRALQLLDEMKERSKGKPGRAYEVQVVYWALAARDDRYLTEVYRWLDKAYEERSFLLVNTSARWYDGYQSDVRWIAFRKKLGLPP